MNKELIDYLESGYDTYLHEAAELLLKQHAAIVKLRVALEYLLADTNDEYIPSRLWDNARAALADTEEFV